jgi:hypothetical protein
MIEIKHLDGRVLYTAEGANDVRTALTEAVAKKTNLRGANLRDAYLGGAYLGGAYLGGAYLGGAYLGGAYLGGANLGGANLEGANLRDANLRGAYLGGAYLRGANLGGANLEGANLRDANLEGANLGGANLGALEPDSPLYPIKLDLWAVLDQAPAEVQGLRQALVEGQVDGSTYTGECACLVGTIANVRKIDIEELPIQRNADRPAERWFIPIREGHNAVPLESLDKDGDEGVFRASVALVWVDQWIESRKTIATALAA